MSATRKSANRVKSFRQARGLSQADLAEKTGISRSGISAIESCRLVPSVEAAIQLARIFECSVEELFGSDAAGTAITWAWQPAVFPCRYWLAEVGGQVLAYPVEASLANLRLADATAASGDFKGKVTDVANRTLVIATCDPAASFLAQLYERQSPFRLLVLSRSSGQALELLEQNLVHAAGVHLARVNERQGNAQLVQGRLPKDDWQLLRVAQWQEGLATSTQTSVRSLRQAANESLRWVGRLPSAGARRCQDEILADRRPPQRTALDHRGVIEAIRNHWADAGICLQLASEEAQLPFFPICEEQYDLCFAQRVASDPRITALVQTIRSAEYRQLISQLPGYRAVDTGEIEKIDHRE
ncbi:substrate-binding domain-containing protein [Anatilimnocola sp. NA78]|uniref:substrate-binding domain-containing protein n=1 Tax=Anatilimnocola sp. NA78 TaxID=3415683 RepID=UPI003CE4EC1B